MLGRLCQINGIGTMLLVLFVEGKRSFSILTSLIEFSQSA